MTTKFVRPCGCIRVSPLLTQTFPAYYERCEVCGLSSIAGHYLEINTGVWRCRRCHSDDYNVRHPELPSGKWSVKRRTPLIGPKTTIEPSRLAWYRRMRTAYEAMSDAQRAELVAWERSHISGTVRTSDWPGWKSRIGDPPWIDPSREDDRVVQ